MNEAAEINGLAMNLEAAARRLNYLTVRGYISPEQRDEIDDILADISTITLQLKDYES